MTTHGRHVAFCLAAAAAMLAVPTVRGEVRTRTIEYYEGDTLLEGYAAWDEDAEGPRPGVLVVHEWYGLNDYARMRARQLAELGYYAFAADIYGRGRRAETGEEAARLSQPFREDRQLLRRRARAALEELRSSDRVDENRIAAIGYCFGGTTVLELARGGADLDAVVSFHGGLDTPNPADAEAIRARVLVCHGARDPHVPSEQVLDFWKEMNAADVDWQMNIYADAVHAFTNPDAGTDPSDGAAYHVEAARRSWIAMKVLFADTIGVPRNEVNDGTGVRIGRFAKEKIAEPVTEAGKTTGRAVKKAATWTWEKIKGDD